MDKKVGIWVVLLMVWIFTLITVLFGWAVGYIHEGGQRISGNLKETILSVSRFPSLASTGIRQLLSPPPLILKDRYPDISGLKLHEKNYTDSNYLLLSVYDKTADHSAIKLLRLSDQKILHQWTPDIKKIMQVRDEGRSISEASNKGNIVLWHPLLSDDGSIVFHTEDRALMKMDKNAELLWSLDGIYHHSLEFDADGNIWASSAMEENSGLVARFFDDYRDDAIAKVSPDGELLLQRSISQILLDNGYRGLLFGIGPPEVDPLHLNDIQPALTSTEYWLKGDLLVSIRNKSTVFLYRPSTNKILWLQTGPWLNQHDADFIDESRIAIFGNNIIRNKNYDLIDGYNEVYIYDFSTNELTTPYTGFLKEAQVKTMTGGRSEVLPNGELFVEETDFGRILKGNSHKTIWEYAERLDEQSTSVLGWTRIITPSEFKHYSFLTN